MGSRKMPKGSFQIPELDLVVTELQTRALRAAAGNHGIVTQARAFGLDKDIPHAIDGKVYRQLVWAKLLTPRQDRQEFTGEALSSEGGKVGYLTAKGDEAAKALSAASTLNGLRGSGPKSTLPTFRFVRGVAQQVENVGTRMVDEDGVPHEAHQWGSRTTGREALFYFPDKGSGKRRTPNWSDKVDAVLAALPPKGKK